LASFGVAEDVSTPLGVISGLIWLGEESAFTGDGDALLENLEATSANLAIELQERYSEVSISVSQIGSLIVTDYGKLKAFSEEPEFGMNTNTQAEATKHAKLASRQYIYQAMLPLAYEPVG